MGGQGKRWPAGNRTANKAKAAAEGKNKEQSLHLVSSNNSFQIASLLKNNLSNFFQSLKLSEQLYCSNSRETSIMKEIEKAVFLKCCYCCIALPQFTKKTQTQTLWAK